MSAKTDDAKGRWRNKTVAFRMSPAEADQLDLLVKLSGISKQDFIIRALLGAKIVVHATVRMRSAIRREISSVAVELRRIRRCGDMPEDIAESVETIARFVGSFASDPSPVDVEDQLIKSLKRDGGHTRQSTAAASVESPAKQETRHD